MAKKKTAAKATRKQKPRRYRIPRYRIPKGMSPEDWLDREARKAGIIVDHNDPRVLRNKEKLNAILLELKEDKKH